MFGTKQVRDVVKGLTRHLPEHAGIDPQELLTVERDNRDALGGQLAIEGGVGTKFEKRLILVFGHRSADYGPRNRDG